ncbi:MAG: spore coat protein CotH [Enterobacterales bacterium]|jgi:spore coat protein CotH
MRSYKPLCLVLALFLTACGGASSSEKKIVPVPVPIPVPVLTGFSYLVSENPDLSEDIVLNINGAVISGRVTTNVAINQLVASFEHNGSQVTVGNVTQVSNTTANDFTDFVTYTVNASDGQQTSYQVDLTKFTGLPIIYLSTDGLAPIDSKDDYVTGNVSVDGGRNYTSSQSIPMEIRGRGNSTWFTHPKKPFQMKLNDKSEMLDMPEDKKWLFLAEYSDKTMLRNTIAFEMGHISSLDWTPKSEFAEVYINDQYNGTYNITEKVEEGDNRLLLGDTGYLLEIDQLDRLDADDVYFYTNNFLVNIKEPDVVSDSSEHVYITDLVNRFENALFGPNYQTTAYGYTRYIDIDSFIDWYLISEITKNVDSKFFSSIYFNVIPGEKIKMGPLWDFDLSFGNVDYADSRYAEGFWVKDNPWFNRLFMDPAFVEKVKVRFDYFRNNQNLILDKIDTYAEQLKWAQRENDQKWQTLGMYVWPNPIVLDTYEEEVVHLKSWYNRRMDWLETALNNL